ncbi:MAG TPA: hypothetical protein VFF47_07270 [Nitrospirota bacterium]|nr:hypothetical protein [Nitrospirota bacterium]
MEIKFSRHAKRRAKLYNIQESTILDLLTSIKLHNGKHVTSRNIVGFQYTLKIIISVEGDTVTVITSYPLKKRRRK